MKHIATELIDGYLSFEFNCDGFRWLCEQKLYPMTPAQAWQFIAECIGEYND